MKTLILALLVLAMANISSAQNVNIPDVNFKNALINWGVDTNVDGEISYAEAEAIYYLNIVENSISDLTGIEAFINLDTLEITNTQVTNLDVSGCAALSKLYCDGNQLISLDVSGCTALKDLRCCCNYLTSLDISNNTLLNCLECHVNQLSSLDVSNNTALLFLECGSNWLSSLDVSACTALTELHCVNNDLTVLDVSSNTDLYFLNCASNQLASLDVTSNTALENLLCANNQLSTLDVSNNTVLEGLLCGGNQLTSLDISNNTALSELSLSNMPTLHKVCVWVVPFPPVGVNVYTTDSPNVYFTTNCADNIPDDYKENSTIHIYPTPSDGIINIKIENINHAIIEIYNLSGKFILSKTLNSKFERIDISGFSRGIYIVKVRQDNTVNVGKVVIR